MKNLDVAKALVVNAIAAGKSGHLRTVGHLRMLRNLKLIKKLLAAPEAENPEYNGGDFQ